MHTFIVSKVRRICIAGGRIDSKEPDWYVAVVQGVKAVML